jgi:predicted TIM-barrel fold metal-dependent hydrolase
MILMSPNGKHAEKMWRIKLAKIMRYPFSVISAVWDEKSLDFIKMQKIDLHMHINAQSAVFPHVAIENRFRLLIMNSDIQGKMPDIDLQRDIAIRLKTQYPGTVQFATTFSMHGWDEPDWQGKKIAYLRESFSMGAIAVKVWKNIGMKEMDQNGRFIMIDDAKFDPILTYLADEGIPVIGHIGEPKNCWLPVEQMTVNSDKTYFKEHPQYHMYLHPEYPSYETLIAARDHMLEKHPDLIFIGCHLGSLEWSVDELAARLDRFPNMAVDLSARICHLQYQSLVDRQKVRNFIMKYQDRIIYGTDLSDDGEENPQNFKDHAILTWTTDWRYFTTTDFMSVPEVDGEFQGLGLPRMVVKKIFRTNSEKWCPGI